MLVFVIEMHYYLIEYLGTHRRGLEKYLTFHANLPPKLHNDYEYQSV